MLLRLTYKLVSAHKNSVLILLMTLSSFLSVAQDKIHLISGIIVEAKIQEITETTIQYKKFNNLNGPIYNVKKTDVKMLVYENGEKVEFAKEKDKKIFAAQYLSSRPSDANLNPDIIVTTTGENIYCTIDMADLNNIKYHLKRSGADPQGIISMAQVTKYSLRNKWYDGYGNAIAIDNSRQLARDLVLSGHKTQAIEAYSKLLVQDSLNAVLLAENAYVMALNGYYDVALYRLDRSFATGLKSSDVNFFTAQVFALMGYSDLSYEFWKESDKNKVPEWIKPKYNDLLNKSKRKQIAIPQLTSEELVTKFKIANILAAQQSYMQSIALFRELTYILPNEYLPYVGYSITLEKVGALNKSVESVEKAISVLGQSTEDTDKRKILEQQLKELRTRATKIPPNTLPGLYQPMVMNINQPHIMAYAGGMVSPSLTNFNMKVGYFVTNSSNGSIDFGYSNASGYSTTNLGMSLYTRNKGLVAGFGLLVNSGEVSTNAYYKLSLGVSIMNKKKTSSFDAFLDLNRGFKKDALSTYGISVGTSLYFGKR